MIVDLTAVLVFPVPDALHEVLPPQIVPRQLLSLPELLLDDTLRGDTSMVTAGKPKNLVSGHSAPSNDSIFDCKHQGVAEMERTGNVGRWNDHDIRLALLLEHFVR